MAHVVVRLYKQGRRQDSLTHVSRPIMHHSPHPSAFTSQEAAQTIHSTATTSGNCPKKQPACTKQVHPPLPNRTLTQHIQTDQHLPHNPYPQVPPPLSSPAIGHDERRLRHCCIRAILHHWHLGLHKVGVLVQLVLEVLCTAIGEPVVWSLQPYLP